MKIFFDTRYTGPHKNATLISIGLVDEVGRSFYGEFSDYYEEMCDPWTDIHIIKYLKFRNFAEMTFLDRSTDNWEAYGPIEYIKTALRAWLLDYSSVDLVSDKCYYNMILFIDIFGYSWDIPASIGVPICHDINQDIARYFGCSEREINSFSRTDIIEAYNMKISEHWPEKCIEIQCDNKNSSLYSAMTIKEVYSIVNHLR
jgi:hypothetical protein